MAACFFYYWIISTHIIPTNCNFDRPIRELSNAISTHIIPTNCNKLGFVTQLPKQYFNSHNSYELQRNRNPKKRTAIMISTHIIPTNCNCRCIMARRAKGISTHIIPTNCNRNQVETTVKLNQQIKNANLIQTTCKPAKHRDKNSCMLPIRTTTIKNVFQPLNSKTLSPDVLYSQFFCK